ncbi:hypothetical protein HDU89_007829 [Geranomyces variabilis]|nr:hypothetical protein HDU89_007829 [Geranomyces variabilis]
MGTCRCGSKTHQRVTHNPCPLHKKRLGPEDDKNNPAAAVTPAEAQASILEIPLPTEVRFMIFDKLPIGAAIRLGQASRSWRAVVSSKDFWQRRAKTSSTKRTSQKWRNNSLDNKQLAVFRTRYRLAVDDVPRGRHTLANVQGFAFARHGGPPGVTAARIEFDKLKIDKTRQIDQALRDRGITSRAEYVFDAEGLADFEKTVAEAERRKALEDGLKAKGLVLRSDSRMGQYFINGDKEAESLEDTISIAETMHIVHAHASGIYKLNLDREYQCIRAGLREMTRDMRDERYYDDSDDEDDESILDDYFDDEWRDAKSFAEGRAVKKFEEALAAYNALPTELRRRSRCACGRPIFLSLL